MESLLLIGLIVAVGVGLIRSLVPPPAEKVIYLVQSAPPAAPQAQGGGIGCLLLLLVGVLALLALFPPL